MPTLKKTSSYGRIWGTGFGLKAVHVNKCFNGAALNHTAPPRRESLARTLPPGFHPAIFGSSLREELR
jgi:hypothetical protein